MIDLSVFLEPKGLIKVLQFIFVICAFACTCDFRGDVVLTAKCPKSNNTTTMTETTYFTESSTTVRMFNEEPSTEKDEAVSSVSGIPMFTGEPSTSSPSALTVEDFGSRDDPLTTILELADPFPEAVQFKTTFKYAFKLEDVTATGKSCNNSDVTMRLGGNYASPSSFYVFVGVSAMLYTLMAISLYTAFKEYYEREWVPVVDLAIHFAYTIMWFAGSIAWAVAVTAIKEESKINSIIDNNPSICSEDVVCSINEITWLLLDFSIVFGFLNFVLYLVNMWFIFKETTFYAKKAHPTIS